jgi:hypothetical protein
MKKIFVVLFLLIINLSFASDIKIITKEIKDSSDILRYTFIAKYPQLEGMNDENIQNIINKEIYETIEKARNEFKNNMSELDLKNIPVNFSSEMEYSYISYSLTDEFYSFAFEVYYYFAGAAHPGQFSKSINYNLKNGKLIELKDLFKQDAKYLEKVSSYCIENLKLQAKQIEFEYDNEMLKEGAGQKDSNFMNFNILQKGLQITFDPYQVAPHVVGTQYVMIPYRVIYEIINENGILNKFDF